MFIFKPVLAGWKKVDIDKYAIDARIQQLVFDTERTLLVKLIVQDSSAQIVGDLQRKFFDDPLHHLPRTHQFNVARERVVRTVDQFIHLRPRLIEYRIRGIDHADLKGGISLINRMRVAEVEKGCQQTDRKKQNQPLKILPENDRKEFGVKLFIQVGDFLFSHVQRWVYMTSNTTAERMPTIGDNWLRKRFR